jgi:predicted  nucleic acid-binding Zn-ribbon protein
MNTSIIVALFSFLGLIINSILLIKTNKKLNDANVNKANSEATNLQVSSASKLINDLRKELERQSKQLEELREEVSQLKTQEKVHLIEKLRLEEKIQALVDENSALKIQVDNNKKSYSEKIQRLNDKIKNLSKELDLHTKSHGKPN